MKCIWSATLIKEEREKKSGVNKKGGCVGVVGHNLWVGAGHGLSPHKYYLFQIFIPFWATSQWTWRGQRQNCMEQQMQLLPFFNRLVCSHTPFNPTSRDARSILTVQRHFSAGHKHSRRAVVWWEGMWLSFSSLKSLKTQRERWWVRAAFGL